MNRLSTSLSTHSDLKNDKNSIAEEVNYIESSNDRINIQKASIDELSDWIVSDMMSSVKKDLSGIKIG